MDDKRVEEIRERCDGKLSRKRTIDGRGYAKTHGRIRTSEYNTWCGMIERCHSKNDKSYPRYGALGISVCNEWRKSFVSFFSFVGPKPSSRHQLDRIDSSRGYEPGNVRWATIGEQARNKKQTVWIEYNGEKLCATDWATRYGIKPTTLLGRIHRGWDTHDALTFPVGGRHYELRKLQAA